MMQYVFLIVGWAFFYAMHSILALDSMKALAKNAFKSYFPYYRMGYNLLSVLLFVMLVFYQFSLPQELLVSQNIMLEMLGAIVFLLGLVVLYIAFSSFNKREFIGLEQLDEIKQPAIIVEKKLVKTGLYGYVRHPLYFGVILMLFGAVLFLPNVPMLLFVMVSLVYLPIGVTLEERKLVAEFGVQYQAYQREVKMLFPFIY
jgi:protein-S-isoprenylcysteine O-methyltransferase Ste14